MSDLQTEAQLIAAYIMQLADQAFEAQSIARKMPGTMNNGEEEAWQMRSLLLAELAGRIRDGEYK